ncbi:uncharacterized protein EV154DRAFT_153559 [Mucor mucedo]|uniref:uncharacterized protein n=1 Tax=Mucor mucedo TaxID=29922 RepID=UPI00221E82FE|nr:uncharacterized protein EV154DRAFT_153559 [Mucor mucedo]KAI7866789.1 hypothetical protein EV154DRAFT_153559 [Mucor mucedo]
MNLSISEIAPKYDNVEWVDTDASEDEDFLPQFRHEQPILPSIKDSYYESSSGSSFESNSSLEQEFLDDILDRKRNRMNSLSWDINTREMFRRKLTISTETPADKVRKAIDKTIDHGIERVDISNVELTEIPDEIGELQYVTVVHNDIVKTASLQIFLYGNYLESINPCLFRLKNLTVLSLRNNRLISIPPDIALLENLVELSLGNNQLTTVPAELLRLKKLDILSLLPNPFLPLPEDNSHRKRIQQRRSSLTEIATRSLLTNTQSDSMIKENKCILPTEILHRFQSISRVNYCEQCKLLFHLPDLEEIIWQSVLKNHHIPVLYRFCSVRCCNTMKPSSTLIE